MLWLCVACCLAAAIALDHDRDPEMQILLTMVEQLRLPYCIWLLTDSPNTPHHTHIRIKQLSSRFIMSLTLSNNSLISLINHAVAVGSSGKPPIVPLSLSHLTQAHGLDVGWPGAYWLLEAHTDDLLPYSLPLDSHVWVWQRHSADNSMRPVYRLRPHLPIVYQRTSTADAIADADIVLHRRNFFDIPLIILKHLEDPCIFDLECIHYLMWQDFGKALNFTAEFVMALGFSGDYDGKAVAAAFHSLDPQPNILAPTYRGKVNLYIAETGSAATGDTWAGYTRVFHPHLWLAVALWLLILAVILTIANRCRRHRQPYLQLLCLPLHILTNQSDTESERYSWTPQDVLTITGRLLLCVVYQAYAAAIVSHLTASHYIFPFTDIDGFRRDGTYTLGSLNNSFSVLLIINSQSEAMQDISKRLLVPPRDMPTTFSEGALRMCAQHKFAFLAYNNLMDNLARHTCPLRRLPIPVAHALAGIPLPPHSHFKPVLNYILLNYKSSGLMNRVERNLSVSYDAETNSGFVPIGPHQLTVPALILLAGAALALISLALEQHFYTRSTRSRVR